METVRSISAHRFVNHCRPIKPILCRIRSLGESGNRSMVGPKLANFVAEVGKTAFRLEGSRREHSQGYRGSFYSLLVSSVSKRHSPLLPETLIDVSTTESLQTFEIVCRTNCVDTNISFSFFFLVISFQNIGLTLKYSLKLATFSLFSRISAMLS